MAQKIKQFRFYDLKANEYNEPIYGENDETTYINDWVGGDLFNDYLPIIQLGIIAPPGTKFYLNNSGTYAIVGYTGLFEADLSGGGSITGLQFSKESLNFVAATPNAAIIVDIIYEG